LKVLNIAGLLLLLMLTTRLCPASPNDSPSRGAPRLIDTSDPSGLEQDLESLLAQEVSTAAKYRQTVANAPSSVTIVTAEEIRRYGWRTLDEVLRAQRGFYTTYDRNYAYIGVRGFSRPSDYNNRLLLLVDGHSLNEVVYGSAFFGTDLALNLDVLDRIEIVRGPGSALYGTGAMFAVVNLITKSPRAIDGADLTGEVRTDVHRRVGVAFGKDLNNGLGITAAFNYGSSRGRDLYYAEYDDPATNNGNVHGLDWDKYRSLLSAVAYRDFKITGMVTWRKKGIPTGAWEMNFNDRRAESLDERRFIELKYEHQPSDKTGLMARAYYDYYNYRGRYPYDILNYDSDDAYWYGGELQFLWDVKPYDRFIFGMEHQRIIHADYRLWDEDTLIFYGNHPFTIVSFYGQNEYQVTRSLAVTLGLRFDEYSSRVRGSRWPIALLPPGSALTPRGAVVWRPNHSSTVKALHSYAFRAPNFYEVYYEDPRLAKGNPDLKPERIAATEFLWEQQLTAELTGSIGAFYYQMDDLINQIKDPADSKTQFRNLEKVDTYGAEAELDVKISTGVWCNLNYTLLYARDVTNDCELSNAPRHTARFRASSPLTRFLTGSMELLYETKRLTLWDTTTDPYFLTNASLTFTPLTDLLTFRLRALNLFNRRYVLPGGYEHLNPEGVGQKAIAQDGRTVSLSIELQF
jgi:iron complex outermembrane receptor protein